MVPNAEFVEPDNIVAGRGAAYLYRVNCGGADYTDIHGNVWKADQEYHAGAWGSVSFTTDYPLLELRYASQRRPTIRLPAPGTPSCTEASATAATRSAAA